MLLLNIYIYIYIYIYADAAHTVMLLIQPPKQQMDYTPGSLSTYKKNPVQ